MRVRQRLGLLAGIAILASGSVLLEIFLLRTYAAVYGQHIALLVLPLALLGAGAGALLVHLMPSLADRRAVFASLGNFASLAAAGAVAALLVAIHVKPPEAFTELGRMVAIGASAALPFAFAGMALAAAFRHARRTPGWVTFAMFSGAAFTGPIAVAFMLAGALRVGIVAGLVDGLAALAFYVVSKDLAPDTIIDPRRPWEPPLGLRHRRPRGAVVATVLLASVVLLTGDLGSPWLRLPSLRFAALDKVDVQQWTPLGLVTVDRMAGASSTWMRLDGTVGTQIFEAKSAPTPAPDEMAFLFHKDQGPVLVLAAGGGREVR